MMEFIAARRLNDLPEQKFSALVSKADALLARGKDVINVGQGNSDILTPEHIVDTLIRSANNSTYYRYPPFRGYDFLKESICKHYLRNYGVSLDVDEDIVIFHGAKTGLYSIAQSMLNKGDNVLLPNPGYTDYLSSIHLSGANSIFFDILEENNYLPCFDSISETLNNNTKIIVLNYPNNPTGAIADTSFYKKAIDFSLENNVFIINDFAYSGIFFDKKQPPSIMQVDSGKECAIEISTLSKNYSMAGWRLAYAVGNKKIISAINTFQDHAFMGIYGALQEAGATALDSSSEVVRSLSNIYEDRINFFINNCEIRLNWKIKKPDGAIYVWARVPKGYTSMDFTKLLLNEANIVVAPGTMFGSNGEGYIRLSMVVDIDKLDEMIDRISLLKLKF